MLNPGWFFPPLVEYPTEPILRDVFEGWDEGEGIFCYLSQLTDMPWKDVEFVDNPSLDLEYFGNHSGAKFCSPIVKYYIEDGVISAEDRVKICKIIVTKFLNNWRRLWDSNIAEYNPIHNYDMEETRTLERGDVESADNIRTSVESTDHGRTNDIDDYVYGMNSDQEGPGRRDSRTESKEGGETSSVNSDISEGSRTKDIEETETTNRKGNIGVTTSQQMLMSEREVWSWNFFEQVYKDIDSVVSLPIYDACRV